jgi:hypothetical protein
VTGAAPEDVLEALKAREPIFHRPEFGTHRSDFEAMTEMDFWEVGASGRVYSHEYVLDALERRHSGGSVEDEWEVDDCACRALGSEVYLFTYRLRQQQRVSRRATVWRRDGRDWKAIYHQGTLVSS